MRILYDVSIHLLQLSFQLAAAFHPKAKAWVNGRRQWRRAYQANFQKKGRVLWVHAASLGEFEQGRPIIEAFREQQPDWQIVLSFFSPSGYSIRKNYAAADFVCYLPADTRQNARDFIDLIGPDAVIFVKYEFWANYLFELQRRQTPTLLVSAIFRPKQPFFRWYGAFWRKMLNCFSHIFVQNQASADLLLRIGTTNVTVAGDTRVDRVLELAEQVKASANPNFSKPISAEPGRRAKQMPNSNLKNSEHDLAGSAPILIAGSTWPADEQLLLPLLQLPALEQLRWIIAPHEPSEKHLAQLTAKISQPHIRYSEWDGEQPAKILLIDSIGLLNSLYRYGWVAYIGGGFGKGIHNTLEPAAFGLPVVFGPGYHKFEEARQFVARGGAFPVENTAALAAVLQKLQNPEAYQKAACAVQEYLEESRGATQQIIAYLAAREF